MNWITTKMPDSPLADRGAPQGHEGRGHHGRVQRDGDQGDEVVIIRPGTDPAFALGLAQVILSQKLYDDEVGPRNTDLPFLMRMDTLQPLRPEELSPRATG
jgi:nitrate reductase alpha subunit